MERVGSRLQGDVHDPALKVAEFGRGVVCDHLELGDGIDARLVSGQVVGDLVIVDTVEEEVVRFLPVSVYVGTAAAGGALPVDPGRRVRRGDARREQGEHDEVATVERKVDVGVTADDRSDLSGVGLKEWRRAGDCHGL